MRTFSRVVVGAILITLAAVSCGDSEDGNEVPKCGDGQLDPLEECDDGNLQSSDGCSHMCQVEAGYQCAGEPSVCDGLCGDGQMFGQEGCDDGNTSSGDGCSQACGVETGYSCTEEPSVCVTVCGDALVAGNEACDDGGDSVACDADCTAALCGDGYVNVVAGESCDGTGETAICDSDCTNVVCGDGMYNASAGEECDDGNLSVGDGCDASCRLELCTGELSTGYVTNGSQYGSMFDVTAVTNITIESFDLPYYGMSRDIEVYYRPGSYVGHATSSAGWTLAAFIPGLSGTNPPDPIPLNLSLNLSLAAGQTMAFYITATNGSYGYSGGTSEGALLVSNADLQIFEGVGVAYPFGAGYGVIYSPRIWNGTIHYCP